MTAMHTAGLGRDAKILLVDDSPAILAMLRDLLKSHGFRNIRTAQSAAEGLTAVEEESPNIIFLDLMMPESSGIEFTQAALEKSPQSRIVLTTALPMGHEAVTMAVSQGAAEYLQKPLRDESLMTVLQHLGREQAQHRPEDIGYF